MTTPPSDADAASIASSLIRDAAAAGLPRHQLPARGTGSEVARDLITNELFLDGSARLNLATFVTTWMPRRAAALAWPKRPTRT